MTALGKTPDGFVLNVEQAEKSLLGSTETPSPRIAPLEPGVRHALAEASRASLIRSLLDIWSQGARPVLLSDAAHRIDVPEVASSSLMKPTALRLQGGDLKFQPSDPVCDLFTSGSTGAPRIFEKCARQVFGEALALKELLALEEDSVILATTASHHLYGLLFGVLAPWAAGARIVASPENEPSNFHPEKIAALVKTHRVSHLISVPAHLRALLQAPVELPTVQTIVSSAAPIGAGDAKQLEEKFGVRVLDVLGSTETGGLATRHASAPAVWTPLPGVRVRLDEGDRLLISSPFLADPAREERSEERARVFADGTFEYLGRCDSVIKVGGKRVDVCEIESLIGKLPGVLDSACFSRSVESLRGEEILLVVATTTLTKEEIRAALRGSIDATFLPRKIRTVSALPRDERGKLKRRDLLSLFEGETGAQGRIEKSLQVPENSPRFSGHFAGDPILPALAQLADFILPTLREAFGGGALASLRRVKWTQAVRPGTELTLLLEEKPQGIHFQLWDGQNLACSGTATLHPEGP